MEIKFIYTIKRKDGIIHSEPFTLDQIENGEARQWFEEISEHGDQLYRRRYSLKMNRKEFISLSLRKRNHHGSTCDGLTTTPSIPSANAFGITFYFSDESTLKRVSQILFSGAAARLRLSAFMILQRTSFFVRNHLSFQRTFANLIPQIKFNKLFDRIIYHFFTPLSKLLLNEYNTCAACPMIIFYRQLRKTILITRLCNGHCTGRGRLPQLK